MVLPYQQQAIDERFTKNEQEAFAALSTDERTLFMLRWNKAAQIFGKVAQGSSTDYQAAYDALLDLVENSIKPVPEFDRFRDKLFEAMVELNIAAHGQVTCERPQLEPARGDDNRWATRFAESASMAHAAPRWKANGSPSHIEPSPSKPDFSQTKHDAAWRFLFARQTALDYMYDKGPFEPKTSEGIVEAQLLNSALGRSPWHLNERLNDESKIRAVAGRMKAYVKRLNLHELYELREWARLHEHGPSRTLKHHGIKPSFKGTFAEGLIMALIKESPEKGLEIEEDLQKVVEAVNRHFDAGRKTGSERD